MLLKGGQIIYKPSAIPALIKAVVEYDQENTDPDTGVICLLFTSNNTVAPLLLTFYNGPKPKNGVYDRFTKLPGIASSNLGTRSFYNHVLNNSIGVANNDDNLR